MSYGQLCLEMLLKSNERHNVQFAYVFEKEQNYLCKDYHMLHAKHFVVTGK